jgi:hypothetical protein
MSHQRSESYSKVKIDDQNNLKLVQVEFSIQTFVLQRLNLGFTDNWEQELTNEITQNFIFNQNCNPKDPPFLKNSFSTGYISLSWKMLCDSEILEIDLNLFFDKDPAHTHITTFLINSEAFPEKVFTNTNRNWSETDKQAQDSSSFDSFTDYLGLGFKHILSGFDHLAFLLALLILKLPIKRLVIIITGFTIGHSLTLALGALDLITPSSQLVEALIGYSILIIAMESAAAITKSYNLYSNVLVSLSFILILILSIFGHLKFIYGLIGMTVFSYCYLRLASKYTNFTLTIAVTCLFGLIHGFGFAGNLSSIGLMEGRLLPAIFGFNIGVELGQILVVIVLSLIFHQVGKFLRGNTDFLRVFTASGLSCIGVFWFLERLF